MKYKHFIINSSNLTEETEGLNKFISTHGIIDVDKYFNDGSFYYSVEYNDNETENIKKQLSLKRQFDEKTLNPDEQIIFERLKACRQVIATLINEKPYIIYHNHDIATLIHCEITSENLISHRVENVDYIKKYANFFVELYNKIKDKDLTTKRAFEETVKSLVSEYKDKFSGNNK